jgi:hypothetical protein
VRRFDGLVEQARGSYNGRTVSLEPTPLGGKS